MSSNNTDTMKYQPVEPVTITQAEFPALHALAARTYELVQLGCPDVKAALESSGVTMPDELLDLAIAISIGGHDETRNEVVTK